MLGCTRLAVLLAVSLTAACGYSPHWKDTGVGAGDDVGSQRDQPSSWADAGPDAVGAGGTGGAAAVGGDGTLAAGGTIGSGGETSVDGPVGSGGTATAASLVADPATLPFGAVTIGQKSAAQNVRISNQGQLASGALALTVDGADFVVDKASTGDCAVGTKLEGGASCTVHVVFAPSAGDDRTGVLTVSGSPGGTVKTSLSGSGTTLGVLTISANSIDFGSTPLGTQVVKSVTVSNTGQSAVTDVQYAVTGVSGQFTRAASASGDCGSTIAPGAKCALRVTFGASARGTFAGAITVAPGNTGAVSATLTGIALGPAVVHGDPTSVDFGGQEVAIVSPKTQTWTITNTGDQPTTSFAFSNTNALEFSTTTTCKAALEPGASCTVTITFTPSSPGPRAATLTATVGDSTATLQVGGSGLYRLTINKVLGGADCPTCSVQSGESPPLIDCGTNCSALYDPGTQFTLKSTTTNGSAHWFSGWRGADTVCKGPTRTCNATLSSTTGSITLQAAFSVMTNNLVFHTSQTVSNAAGSAKAYDTFCNTVASAAGINNANGTGYVAWVSDSNSLASDRVFANPSTQGWVCMDGRVFATTKDALLGNWAVLSPVLFDEQGARTSEAGYLTGTNPDGTASQLNCNNWTSTSSALDVGFGLPAGGPDNWTAVGFANCSMGNYDVLCMGITSSAAATVTRTQGKRMWLTATPFIVGSGTPDAWCATNAPSGVAGAKALVARTGSTAALLLTPTAVYVRPDGQRIGTGAEIVAITGDHYFDALDNGIWQDNLGAYKRGTSEFSQVWTGAKSLSERGTVASTCGDWTDPSQVGAVYGIAALADGDFFGFSTRMTVQQVCNDPSLYLYCVEP